MCFDKVTSTTHEMRGQNVLAYKTISKSEQFQVIEAYYKIYELSLWKSDAEALLPNTSDFTQNTSLYTQWSHFTSLQTCGSDKPRIFK